MFMKCVGCFPVFLVMVKKQFSKVFVVNARAQAVSHKLLKWVRHLRISGLLLHPNLFGNQMSSRAFV